MLKFYSSGTLDIRRIGAPKMEDVIGNRTRVKLLNSCTTI